MDFQGFGEELRGCRESMAPKAGRLLLALFKDEPAGTIALRRLDGKSGEVKRLYLRPQFRGHGLGRRLLEAVIERALDPIRLFVCRYAPEHDGGLESLRGSRI